MQDKMFGQSYGRRIGKMAEESDQVGAEQSGWRLTGVQVTLTD